MVFNSGINLVLSLRSLKHLVLSLILIGVLEVIMVNSNRQSKNTECVDNASWCKKLGRKIPLSRCYDPRHRSRCCASCEKLMLPLPGFAGCEFGDHSPLCSTIGKSRPVGDCYGHNKTCCQTCNLYDTGIPGCPFGDRVTWCEGIGESYMVSSCYDHEIHCCKTCQKFRTGIQGCRYGDRGAWCHMIGSVLPVSSCDENEDICCQTCKLFREAEKKFPLIESDSSTNKTLTWRDNTMSSTRTTPNTVISDANNGGGGGVVREANINNKKTTSQVLTLINNTQHTTPMYFNHLLPNHPLHTTTAASAQPTRNNTPNLTIPPWQPSRSPDRDTHSSQIDSHQNKSGAVSGDVVITNGGHLSANSTNHSNFKNVNNSNSDSKIVHTNSHEQLPSSSGAAGNHSFNTNSHVLTNNSQKNSQNINTPHTGAGDNATPDSGIGDPPVDDRGSQQNGGVDSQNVIDNDSRNVSSIDSASKSSDNPDSDINDITNTQKQQNGGEQEGNSVSKDTSSQQQNRLNEGDKSEGKLNETMYMVTSGAGQTPDCGLGLILTLLLVIYSVHSNGHLLRQCIKHTHNHR